MSFRPWILPIIITIIFIAISYFYFDIPIASYFYEQRNSLIVSVASILTNLGEGVYYIVPSLILFLYWRKRNPVYGKTAFFIFATTASSGIIVNLLKVFFARYRPKMYFSEQLYGFDWFHTGASMASFPSGHSTTAMGVWFAFALLLPKYRYLLLSIGVLIVSTRIIVTAHYLSDTLAGSLLGVIVTLICYHFIFIKDKEPSRG